MINANHLPILVDYNLTQITPFVYVADEETVRQWQPVFSNNINCVINVACESPQMLFPLQSGIESIKYPIKDVPNFPAVYYFDMIADRIADNVLSNRRTLVYCRYGRSRSITFILAYLIKYHHLPLSIAYTIIQEQRKLALPNIGFWTQLRLYEIYQQEKNSSKTLINIQNSLQEIFDGFKQIFIEDPMINTLTIHKNQINRNRMMYPRPSIRNSYPYQRKQKPFFHR